MLDRDGYRPNVGIILLNRKNEVFWGKRIKEHSWQFPQGGIDRGESPEHAMYRELYEEVGLFPEHVRIIGRTRDWLRYEVPRSWIRSDWRGHYKGQKQIWYLLRLVGKDTDIQLRATDHPEFDAWRWSDYWIPLDSVIDFKRGVYRNALIELARFLQPKKSEGGAGAVLDRRLGARNKLGPDIGLPTEAYLSGDMLENPTKTSSLSTPNADEPNPTNDPKSS